jgi:hypothetical protein
MERKFETMVRWRFKTIVQWIDRFEAPIAELEVARDDMAAYTEEELIYLWKQTFADNVSGEEIQVINTHMPRYVDANSLTDVQIVRAERTLLRQLPEQFQEKVPPV